MRSAKKPKNVYYRATIKKMNFRNTNLVVQRKVLPIQNLKQSILGNYIIVYIILFKIRKYYFNKFIIVTTKYRQLRF